MVNLQPLMDHIVQIINPDSKSGSKTRIRNPDLLSVNNFGFYRLRMGPRYHILMRSIFHTIFLSDNQVSGYQWDIHQVTALIRVYNGLPVYRYAKWYTANKKIGIYGINQFAYRYTNKLIRVNSVIMVKTEYQYIGILS